MTSSGEQELINRETEVQHADTTQQNEKKVYFTRAEVEKHNTEEDLWVVINNKVYELSKYIKRHPGGKKVMKDAAGKDASEKWFLAGHSHKAQELMKEFVIGEVYPNETYEILISAHKSKLAEVFPYIGFLIFLLFIFICIRNSESIYSMAKSSNSEKIDIFPFLLGIFPSIFLIMSAINLWFGKTFRTHRIGGLSFLIQYAFSWYFYFTDYAWFKESFLVWSLLLNGCLQAITAIIEIGPTLSTKDNGEYFGNKGQTVSRDFIVENLYYQILTTFSSLYYYPQYYNFLKSNIIGKVIEIVFVFLPFAIVRPFFPKTVLRDALKKSKDLSTNDHTTFFMIANLSIKFVVIFGKHYMGLFLNAVRFIGGLNSPHEEKLLQFMMLANAGTVSVSTFLHTLKFKNQLPAKIAMTVYLMFLYTPAIAIYQMVPHCYPYWKMFIIFTVGAIINFTPRKIQFTWYYLIAGVFILYENNLLSDEVRSLIY